MTIKELKSQLDKFDENLEVGGCGHFGELLQLSEVGYHVAGNYVFLEIESAGDEPE